MCPEAYGLTGVCRIATGQYTGDGTLALPIVGIGFRVRFVWITRHPLGEQETNIYERVDQFAGAFGFRIHSTQTRPRLDTIISLDVDGFTVGDDNADIDPNTDGILYDFMCLG